MLIGKTYNKDCVFKQGSGDNTQCQFPKRIKMCYGCGCYLKNTGNIKEMAPYISMVTGRKTSNLSLLISLMALIISLAALLLKIAEVLSKPSPTPPVTP